MKQAIRIILTTLVSYCAIAFILWQYNPQQWINEMRFALVMIVFTIEFFVWIKKIDV